MFASVSLSLNASLADFIGSFSSVSSLSPSVTRWLNAIGLDDILLDRLASNGVLNFAAGASSWNCRKLSDDALISFAFGDSYANDRLRSMRGFECQLSKTFIVKLVQVGLGRSPSYRDSHSTNTNLGSPQERRKQSTVPGPHVGQETRCSRRTAEHRRLAAAWAIRQRQGSMAIHIRGSSGLPNRLRRPQPTRLLLFERLRRQLLLIP